MIQHSACVLAVGKFEGIHLGHRALISQVVRRARAAGIAAVVAVFEPHPYKFLRDADYKPLFSPHERDEMIYALGVDTIVSFDFNEKFASMSARDFCEKIFIEMRAKEIIAGENFRFGRERGGTIETLRGAGEVFVIGRENFVGEIVSTSRIRELLAGKDFFAAESLLGFSFFIAGEVTEGRRLGRTLGFPTLNIYPPSEKFLPQNGVYATRTIIDGATYSSVTNIGTRPTVSDGEGISVETHIWEAAPGELYGTQIKVEFLRFIRAEKKFASLDELKGQIAEDIASIRQ
ncbi:MAG: bifunctional riboflavin kinase/FAD synthetase [Defluviitaleaceae bacterium]|nr:bifunctional riboflavin kinase/FAD synthetase [Defluviitaleaceae bacterium]